MLNFKKLLLGLLLSLLLSALLIAFVAFMVLKLGFLPSDPVLGTLSAVVGGASVFVASVFTAHRIGERGLLHGLILGTAYALLYVAVGVMLYANMQCIPAIIRTVIFELCGVCGGVVGVNKSEKVGF